MPTRAAFVQLANHQATGTATFPSISWNAGDLVIVVLETADQATTYNTPTGGPGGFTAIGSPATGTNACWGHKWQATAGSAGSGVISSTVLGGGTHQRGGYVEVWSNHAGVGNHVALVSTALTASLTRSGANSAVSGLLGDWGAGSTSSPAWTPTSNQPTQVSSDGGLSSYSLLGTYWGNEGAAGSASYGLTSGFAGSSANITKLFVEILDGAPPAPDPQWIKQMPGPGLMGPADPLKWEPWRGVQIEPSQPYPVDLTSSVGSGTTSAALTISPKAVAGDMLLVVLSQAGAQDITSVIPASLVQPPGAIATNTGNTARLIMLYCVLTASDISTGTIQVTWGATQRHVITGMIVRKHAGVVDVVGTGSTGSTVSSVSVPAATPTVANELIVGAVGGQVNTTSTDITWSGWSPLQDFIDIMGTGAVARAFLTIATNVIGEPRVSGPDAPVPTGSTISYGAFRITIPAVFAAPTGPSGAAQDSSSADDFAIGSKMGTSASVDATTPSDVALGAKSTSRAATDATTPTDRPAGRKQAATTASDATTPADRPAGAKVASGATATSTAPSDRPAGRKQAAATSADSTTPADAIVGSSVAGRTTADSTTPADALVGRKQASGATQDSTTPAGRPAGLKGAVKTTTDSTTPADRPLGAHGAIRSATDSTTPTETLVGRKQATATAVDSTTSAETGAGKKSTSRAAQDSTTPQDWGTTGISFTHLAVDSTTPSDRPVGSKTGIRAQADSTTPADRPGSASRSANASGLDSTTPREALAGRKQASGSTVESAIARSALAGKHGATGSSRVSTTPTDAPAGRKQAAGATRTSATPSEVLVRVLLFRDVDNSGDLVPTGVAGALVGADSGVIDSPTITGRIKPPIGGRVTRRVNP